MKVCFCVNMELSLFQPYTGRYISASDVEREALRRLERADRREEDQAERLRRAWTEGIDSGDAGSLYFSELREAARHAVAASRKE
jgi:antitoxin ParD1/3/4